MAMTTAEVDAVVAAITSDTDSAPAPDIEV
jgi:hypothetical protein